MPYASTVAQRLVREVLADLSDRYGGDGDATPVQPSDFEPPHGAFLVAYRLGQPVGCGAWRTHLDGSALDGSALDGSALDGSAEIKRMYVVPAARGQGIALALLRALEDSARQAGRTRAILETGTLQPEAIALYGKAGYRRIADFGHYKDEPGVRSFGRDL